MKLNTKMLSILICASHAEQGYPVPRCRRELAVQMSQTTPPLVSIDRSRGIMLVKIDVGGEQLLKRGRHG